MQAVIDFIVSLPTWLLVLIVATGLIILCLTIPKDGQQ